MSLPALANDGVLSLAAALIVLVELCWALYPAAWNAQDEPGRA
jgi:hypothetical protein